MSPYWYHWINNGEETNVPCRKIPNNLCSYSAPNKVVEWNSPILKCALCVVTSFQRAMY